MGIECRSVSSWELLVVFFSFFLFFFVIKKRLQKEGEMSYPHTPKAYKKKVHN